MSHSSDHSNAHGPNKIDKALANMVSQTIVGLFGILLSIFRVIFSILYTIAGAL